MDLAFSAQNCPVDLQPAAPRQCSPAAPVCCERGKRCARCGGWRRYAENCFGCLSFQVVAVRKKASGKRENRRLLVFEWVFSINFSPFFDQGFCMHISKYINHSFAATS